MSHQRRLRGWPYRTRTSESARELPDWIYVTIRPEIGAMRWRRPLACQLHEAHLQLGPRFSRRSFSAEGDRIQIRALSQGSVAMSTSESVLESAAVGLPPAGLFRR